MSCFPQLARELHREAAGVSGGDEFLGVGAVALLEARLKRVRALIGAAGHSHGALAGLQGAVPAGLGLSLGHLNLRVVGWRKTTPKAVSSARGVAKPCLPNVSR